MESAGLPPPARPGPAATRQEMIEADLLALGELAEAKAGQVVAVLSPGDVLPLWRWRPRAVDIWGVRQTDCALLFKQYTIHYCVVLLRDRAALMY